jgi:hypothetical protein
MDRRYSAKSPYSTAPTERFDTPTTRLTDGGVDYADHRDYPAYEDYPYDGGPEDAYADYDDESAELDRRWVWVAGVAGAVLLVAVICTVVILGGGDSGSVTATIAPPETSQPVTTSAAPPAATSTPSLPAETVTTVTPSPSASAPESPTTEAPPPAVAAPPPSPRTVTYQVTGTRPLLDLVTVIYTDQQGALQTDVNVALPWSKTVVLDPGVELKSVTATSVTGRLNCSITDGAGATLVSQANNSMIATCTQ